jgi:hypothetical protein
LFDSDIEKKLLDIGATKKVNAHTNDYKHEIKDEYYDHVETFFLLVNFHLLRSRTQFQTRRWQVSYPSKMDLMKSVNNYYEVSKDNHIMNLIVNLSRDYLLVKPVELHQNHTIESLIDEMEFKPIATIISIRKSFLYDNICIDLDETDFGYKIGQMELVLEDKQSEDIEMEKVIKSISDLTSKLGSNFQNYSSNNAFCDFL